MAPCRHCKGLGYIPVRGEAMAADPCGWCEEAEAEDERDPDEERETREEDQRLREEEAGLEDTP